jgi:hypothetical protein
MAAAQKNQQGQQAAATAGAADKNKGQGINMQPANARTGVLPPQDPEAAAYQMEQGGPAGSIQGADPAIRKMQGHVGSMTPESKMQQAVEKANAGKFPLTPEQAGKFGTGNLLTPDFGASGKDIAGAAAKKDGMSFDEKMQMAAIAASLGSVLAGPGAPPPPGAPRGGGIGMSPVFQQMTARGLYG